MRHKTQAKNLPPNENATKLTFEYTPGFCPICHHSIAPIGPYDPTIAIYPNTKTPLLQLIFRCPRNLCGNLFLAQYNEDDDGVYKLSKCLPKTAKPSRIEKQISELSPAFVKILNQAVEAEAHGLDEVSGVALRKAFEFLIKDYCINRNPDKEKIIKKTFLGACIKEFVDDPKIKKCAEKAVWLGNDETHYERRWEDKDINDLKTLIQLSMNWIVNEKLTEEYMKSFEKPKNGNPEIETK